MNVTPHGSPLRGPEQMSGALPAVGGYENKRCPTTETEVEVLAFGVHRPNETASP